MSGYRTMKVSGAGKWSLAPLLAVGLLPLTAVGVSHALAPGVLLGLAMIPRWTYILNHTWVRLVAGSTLAMLAWGFALGHWVHRDRAIDPDVLTSQSALVLAFVFQVPLLVWSFRTCGLRLTTMVYAAGHVINGFLVADQYDWTDRWKYELSWPVTVLLLAALSKRGRLFGAGALVAAATSLVLSVAMGYRSLIAFLIVAAVLAMGDKRRRNYSPDGGGGVEFKSAVRLGVLICAVVLMAQGFAFGLGAGWFGEEAQRRTQQQTMYGQGVLSGGRVEPIIAWELFRHRPSGYGAGVVPSTEDISVGTNALIANGYVTGRYYLLAYVLNGRFKLHSTLSDYWVSFGVGGVVAWAILASFLVRTALIVPFRSLGILGALVFVWTCWDMLFSPIYSNLPFIGFSVALLLWLSEDQHSAVLSSSSQSAGRLAAFGRSEST